MLRKSSWSNLFAVLLAACFVTGPTGARTFADALAEVRLADLPREAGQTLALIKRGGPFPNRKDGSVFANRERRLPAQARGYYTEYTVRTPGSTDRGARRIIAGRGSSGAAATSGEYYYTGDHYETFHRILESPWHVFPLP